MINELKEFIDSRNNQLECGIVATPNMTYLEAFAKANHGSNDYLLMQMAIQVGYKMAIEDIEEIIELNEKK